MDSNILEQYALRLGHDPKKLMDDYFDSSEKEQMELMSHILQSGGEVGGSTQEANMQIVQLFAQKTGTPVEQIVAQLQQMSPEEQSAAIGDMMSVVEQPEVAQDGFDARSLLGYSDNSPYKYDTSNLIKSNSISMANTGVDLIGKSDTGDIQYMPAYSGDYDFEGNEVTEYPVYQTGFGTIDISRQNIYPNKLENKNKNITVKGKNRAYNLAPFSNNSYRDEDGKKWIKTPTGQFIMNESPTKSSTPQVVATETPASKTRSKYIAPKDRNPYKLNNQSYQPKDSSLNPDELMQSLPGYTAYQTPATTEAQRAQVVGESATQHQNRIPYSPKIEGITPEKSQAKSQYKFNTSSPLGDLINNFKVAKSFEAIDLPYMQEVDARMPEGVKYDPRPGLQAIEETYGKYKQGINPNSSTGQAVLASLAGKQQEASNQYLNNLQQQQAQADYQQQLSRADLYNKIVQQRNANAANYTDGVLRADANRDTIIDSTLSNVQQIQANNQLTENAYSQMLAFNANVEDESRFFDKLLGRKKISFNKDKAYAQNFGV